MQYAGQFYSGFIMITHHLHLIQTKGFAMNNINRASNKLIQHDGLLSMTALLCTLRHKISPNEWINSID